ncbi:MAG: GT4 family glycosyltransferase PelF [Actinomycetales bacterium]|nr:GT4 family glycosyltransferase PelF [Actinomycetales bacterium]
MRVALVTEGTYPHAHGGVSVWCDQLVRGMPEHEFQLLAITGTATEDPVWALPPNVTGVVTVPLWGPWPDRPGGQDGRRATGPRWPWSRPIRTLPDRPPAGVVGGILTRFVEALLTPDPVAAVPVFRQALDAWSRIAAGHDMERELTSAEFVTLLLDRWSADETADQWGGARDGYPRVGDAVTASQLIAHALRPLAVEPPRVDLVHLVANGIAGLVGLSATWRHGVPYVLSEHGIYLRERYLAYRDSPYPWPVKWVMLRFYRLLTATVYAEAALVAPGNLYNRRWEQRDGVPAEAIRTVYNGVDPDEFALVGTEPEVPTLAWVGRIDPIKDLATMLRAFALVHERAPEVRLRVFGGTPRGNEPYRAAMEELAAELGITGSVTFEGRVPSIRDAYAAGHVVVLTSISEGFPYTVIEAMSSGRATVSSDVGGVAEAVGDAGIVVPPREPEAVARACLSLLTDDARRRRLAARARCRVVELFTLDRSIDAFRAIYADLGTPDARADRGMVTP